MMWGFLAFLVFYGALKSARVAMMSARPGYRKNEVAVWQKVRSGEPYLLILAALVSFPLALAATWYHRYKFETVLESSAECFAIINAYQKSPEIMRSNGEFAVYRSEYGYRWSALDAAWQLGLKAGQAETKLANAARSAQAEQARLPTNVRQERIASARSCLHPPPDPANA